jgi:hypothetical protein
MYCLRRKDRIYFTKDATGRIYYLDLTTNVVKFTASSLVVQQL